MSKHEVKCYSKLNLALSVGGVNADGMHPICSWMVKIDFYDTLKVTTGEDLDGEFGIGWGDDALRVSEIDWPVMKDLAYRAWELGAGKLGIDVDAMSGELIKRVPVGAGLGGGSADGAGMLSLLGEMGLSEGDMYEIAKGLGSDVPFFLGGGSAVISGLGEVIESMVLDEVLHFTLVLPELSCNTGKVYGCYDKLCGEAEMRSDDVMGMAKGNDVRDEVLFNDLAEAAFEACPELRGVRDKCVEVVGRPVHVTGSGAALFVLAKDGEDAERQAKLLRDGAGVVALGVKTI